MIGRAILCSPKTLHRITARANLTGPGHYSRQPFSWQCLLHHVLHCPVLVVTSAQNILKTGLPEHQGTCQASQTTFDFVVCLCLNCN